jgi:hypothetical protein
MVTARHSNRASSHEALPHPLLEETQEYMLNASARLLADDPEAVFTHLATTTDPGGDLTTAFWHLLVSRGDAEAIAGTLQRLRGGPEVDLAVFSSRGTDPDYEYPYARNLAFAAATLNRGFTQSAEDARGDIDVIARVAGVATAVTGLYSSAAAITEMAMGAGTEWTIDGHAAATRADIDSQLAHLIDAATSRLRPPDGADLAPFPDGGNALLAWTIVYTRLLPHA